MIFNTVSMVVNDFSHFNHFDHVNHQKTFPKLGSKIVQNHTKNCNNLSPKNGTSNFELN